MPSRSRCARRGGDRGIAIVQIVRQPHRIDAGRQQRGAAGIWIGEETFVLHAVPGRRRVEATFQIAEPHIGALKKILNPNERHTRIGHVHQVHIAGEDHGCHISLLR